MNHPIKNEIGNRYGRLVVVALSHKTKYGCQWLCKCDCGNEVVVGGVQLRNGHKRSCRCLEKERLRTYNENRKANAKYEKPSKLYNAWANMKYRCYNKDALEYSSYGGRGIRACDEWMRFKPFEKWALENGYAEGLTLDRIDVNGNYEPSNCRWIERSRQSRNKRDTIYVEYNGEKRPLIDLCEELGVSYSRAFWRIKNGKTDVAEILSRGKLKFKLTEDGLEKLSQRSKVPYYLEKDGIIHGFDSAKEASDFIGVTIGYISRCCKDGKEIRGYKISKEKNI